MSLCAPDFRVWAGLLLGFMELIRPNVQNDVNHTGNHQNARKAKIFAHAAKACTGLGFSQPLSCCTHTVHFSALLLHSTWSCITIKMCVPSMIYLDYYLALLTIFSRRSMLRFKAVWENSSFPLFGSSLQPSCLPYSQTLLIDCRNVIYWSNHNGTAISIIEVLFSDVLVSDLYKIYTRTFGFRDSLVHQDTRLLWQERRGFQPSRSC